MSLYPFDPEPNCSYLAWMSVLSRTSSGQFNLKYLRLAIFHVCAFCTGDLQDQSLSARYPAYLNRGRYQARQATGAIIIDAAFLIRMKLYHWAFFFVSILTFRQVKSLPECVACWHSYYNECNYWNPPLPRAYCQCLVLFVLFLPRMFILYKCVNM